MKPTYEQLEARVKTLKELLATFVKRTQQEHGWNHKNDLSGRQELWESAVKALSAPSEGEGKEEKPFRLPWAPKEIARRFHEAYERLAPSFGYTTREASAVPWEKVPPANRCLMIAVVRNVLIEQLACLVKPASTVAKWTQEHPNESGLFWMWNGEAESAPIPVTIMLSGCSGQYFVSGGQWGWTRHQEFEELEGYWWMPCPEPTPRYPSSETSNGGSSTMKSDPFLDEITNTPYEL